MMAWRHWNRGAGTPSGPASGDPGSRSRILSRPQRLSRVPQPKASLSSSVCSHPADRRRVRIFQAPRSASQIGIRGFIDLNIVFYSPDPPGCAKARAWRAVPRSSQCRERTRGHAKLCPPCTTGGQRPRNVSGMDWKVCAGVGHWRRESSPIPRAKAAQLFRACNLCCFSCESSSPVRKIRRCRPAPLTF